MNEPPPAIQPHGFLIGLSDEWVVLRASLNSGKFLGRDPSALIGTAATEIFAVEAVHALRNRLALIRGDDAVERLFRCSLMDDGRHFDVAVHFAGGETILEAEPSTGKSYGDVTSTMRGMMRQLDDAGTLAQLLDAGINQLRAMTGFDRVAVRRFDLDGSSSIVAESARRGMQSTLGQPGEPIGPAAMDRLRRVPVHLLVDTEAQGVAVEPGTMADGSAVDLSLAVLRMNPPAVIEALHRDGILASMSIALTAGERLWGMIECHHRFARAPSYERRAMVDLFAQMFAMRIRILELEGKAPVSPD